jgi:lon-related putative ATP-dependent protease
MQAATDRWKLTPAELDVQLDPAALGFRSTAELEALAEVVGQDRAMRALEFGLALRQRGYNVYVSGLSGTDKPKFVEQLLTTRARQAATPDDWVYVHNFEDPDSPLALRLSSGDGVRLRRALKELIERLGHDLPEMLKAKDFDTERDRLSAAYGERSKALYDQLAERARQLEMLVRRLPNGVVVFIPLRDGRPMEPEELERLTEGERAAIHRREEELAELAGDLMVQQQELMHQLRAEVQAIIRTFAGHLISPLIAEIQKQHPGAAVARWLDQVRDHLLDHLEKFQEGESAAREELPPVLRAMAQREDRWLEYRVNVVVDNAHTAGAPIVAEPSPNYKNLFGTVERDINLFGQVTTDFSRIKPGSLLRANGGYLILDLEDALTEPLVWKQLKRTLKSGQLHTDAYDPFALFTAAALKPQPIPIDTKVIAIGPPGLYYLLQYLDTDFKELFKVRADFGYEMPRDAAGHQHYGQFIAKLGRAEQLPPFAAGAVVEVIRFGARAVAHRGKLSVDFDVVADLVREAGHWARASGAALVEAGHVHRALDERRYRNERLAAKVRELIQEDTLRVSVTGTRVGQVNGLALWDLGDLLFARPTRVTASTGIGQEGIVNIERESQLSGSTHDKGVLILEGFLRNRYARHHPLSLSASLAFEQSYGWVEGDSASSAELYCLLSAVADVPLRQDIAVTGSVNQHGEVQAVGGANEKIEGFYEICRLKGLTGTQGVCIPRSNVRHLILRPDVVQAVADGHFHIWAIDTIEEGIELLTGMPAGDLDQAGTFHHRVDERLKEMLAVLGEEPVPGPGPRISLTPAAAPKPAPPPPLPGDGRR